MAANMRLAGIPSGISELFHREPEYVPEDIDLSPVVFRASIVVQDSDSEIQFGVKQAKAIAASWSPSARTAAYAGIYLVLFVLSLQQQVTASLTPFVTSTFKKHSLVATTAILSSIIGAVVKLPVAKIIDTWGRSEGFFLMVACCTLGLIMMTCCQNVTTYAAAQVFYWVGHNGVVYVLQVFLADTSSLMDRGWLFAFSMSPYIATTFAGPAAAEAIFVSIGWRWAFAIFSIMMPVASLPILYMFARSRDTAEKQGYLTKKPSGRSFIGSVRHYLTEFDVIGMILAIAGFALILLPISLSTNQTANWKSPAIIAMLAVGGSCLIAFAVWERFFARVCLAPFHLLVDRMVLGTCLLSTTMFASFYCWDTYFCSFVQVVYNLSIRDAGLLVNVYSIATCVWAIVTGGIIRVTGRIKYLALLAIPLQAIFVALMIYLRKPLTEIRLLIWSQFSIGISGGTLVICEQMAVMAVAKHSETAVVLALLGLFSSVGGAIGQAISGAIWTHMLPKALRAHLPESEKDKAAEIYASLEKQLSHRFLESTRKGITKAYGVVQVRILIIALCILSLGIIWILMWRNVQLKSIKRNQKSAA